MLAFPKDCVYSENLTYSYIPAKHIFSGEWENYWLSNQKR